jgi:hypothetical protein
MFAYELYATLIDPQTQRRLINKRLEETLDVGKVKLVLSEGDLVNITPGRYYIYVSRKINDHEVSPIYKDQDNNVRFDIEITDQLGMEPAPSQSTDNFVQTADTNLGANANVFVGEPMAGNLCRNFLNAMHTMVITTAGYAGNITIQASGLNDVPTTMELSEDWYDVKTIELRHDTFQLANTALSLTNIVRVRSNADITIGKKLYHDNELLGIVTNVTENSSDNFSVALDRRLDVDIPEPGFVYTGQDIVVENFHVNAQWLRVISEPGLTLPGRIVNVQVRN